MTRANKVLQADLFCLDNHEIKNDVRKYNTTNTIEWNKNIKVLKNKPINGNKEMFKLKIKNEITANSQELLTIAESFFYGTIQKQRSERDVQVREDKTINQRSKTSLNITLQEIINRQMKNNKSAGKDEVIIEAVKIGEKLLLTIAQIFNLFI